MKGKWKKLVLVWALLAAVSPGRGLSAYASAETVRESEEQNEGEARIQGEFPGTEYTDKYGYAFCNGSPEIWAGLTDPDSGIAQITWGIVDAGGENLYAKKLRADETGNVTGDTDAVSSVTANQNLVTGVRIADQWEFEDGIYIFWMEVRERTGDVSRWSERFELDTKNPVLGISGVSDEGVYNTAISPQITCADENLAEDSFQITLSSEDGIVWSYQGQEGEEDQISCCVSWFETQKGEEGDGVYELQARAKDKAGNEAVKTCHFLINRYGSIYSFSETAAGIDGSCLAEAAEVVLTEKNLSPLIEEDIVLKINRSGVVYELEAGEDYQLEIRTSGSWNIYRYTIPKEVFEKDGVYAIFAESEDEALNQNASYGQTGIALGRGAELTFSVDKTAPVILSMQAQERQTEKGKKQAVIASGEERLAWKITDNLSLKEVHVFVDGKEADYMCQKGIYEVELGRTREDVLIEVSAEDKAGNTAAAYFLRTGLTEQEKTDEEPGTGAQAGGSIDVSGEIGNTGTEKNSLSQYPIAQKAKEILEQIKDRSIKFRNMVLTIVVIVCVGILAISVVYLTRRH